MNVALNYIKNDADREKEAKVLHEKHKNGWNPFSEIEATDIEMTFIKALDFSLIKKSNNSLLSLITVAKELFVSLKTQVLECLVLLRRFFVSIFSNLAQDAKTINNAIIKHWSIDN